MNMLFGSFFLLMIMTCGYALYAGGRDGRIACALLFSAASLTPLMTLAASRLPLLGLDALLLLGLVALALSSRSFWPLWLAGLHCVTVAEGIATQLVPLAPTAVLHAVTGFWAIPMQVVMGLGIFLDRRGYRHADRTDLSG